jgi:hypothetical protein
MTTKNKRAVNKTEAAPKKQAKKVPVKTPESKKSDKEFPGYPKYGSANDITTQAKRVDENLDDEVLTQVKHNQEIKTPALNVDQGTVDDQESKPKNAFDVTEEDMEALGPKDLSMDGGEDEQLKHRNRPVDFTGEDLDVPGTELDDDQEATGMEDEENNIYSLGGDEKNNLEEGQEHEGSL